MEVGYNDTILMLTHQLVLVPGLPVEIPHNPDLPGALPHCEHLVRVALLYAVGHGAPLGVLGAHPDHRGVASSGLANLDSVQQFTEEGRLEVGPWTDADL